MPLNSAPLRIALVSLHTSPSADPGAGDAGGMNVVIRHQAEALAARGHSVDILTRRASVDVPNSMALAPGLTLRFLDAGPAEPIPKGDHEAFIGAFRERASALGPYDIIHSHHWFSGMAALPVARSRGIPHVQSFHSIAAAESTPLSAGERPESAGRLTGEAWLAQASDAVVAVSRAEAETVVSRLGGAEKRITVVPPGVDGALFRPGTPEPLSGRGYALVAGRLQPLKGFDLAVEAVAALSEDLRPELIIAGDASAEFDEYIGELRALAARHGIARHVQFVGPQSRSSLATLLRGARVVLVPSHSETYGLVALEAAASGVPVVAAASGGLREAVIDGQTGIVVESRDPRVWAEAITGILSDPDADHRLSQAARRYAEQLDWSRSAERLLAVYRSVVESVRPGSRTV